MGSSETGQAFRVRQHIIHVPRFLASDFPGVRRYELRAEYGVDWLEAVDTGRVVEIARVREARTKQQRVYLQRFRREQDRRVYHVCGSFDEADIWLDRWLALNPGEVKR
jgi:hypothetical protein